MPKGEIMVPSESPPDQAPRGWVKPLELLLVDDSDNDVELTLAEIRQGGFKVNLTRASTLEEAERALSSRTYDCIVCDHKMPGFSSFDVLKIARSLHLDTPFLIVSGVIGEEIAVEALRSGAHDYILKNNLIRLVPAIERELREAKIRAENRERLKMLKESERRFRAMAEAAPTMIWICNDEGVVEYLNKTWRDFTGLSEETERSVKWGQFIHPDDREKTLESFKDAFSRHAPFTIEYRLQRNDGEWRNLLDKGAPRFDGGEAFQGYIGSAIDVTEQIRLRLEAEQANRAKSAFLANMSHEIRTPLGAILGFTDLLRDEDVGADERKHYLDIITRNGQELLRLIGDILDLSKIEAGRFELEWAQVRIRDVVSDVISLLKVKAAQKRLGLDAVFEEGLSEYVETDRTRLRQILINVVGNAIKFTERGWVRIVVSRADTGLRIAVEDTGPGVPRESRAKLFQAFSQGDNSTTRAFGGTGLGLALSRHMARLLGGDVRLDENFSGGARFEITIAVVKPEQRQGPVRAKSSTAFDRGPAPLKGINVLLVEDLKDNQFLVKSWLERNGARVDTAENGEEGIRKAEATDPTIVLMDIHMPVLDGYEATKRLRRHGFRKPIIALTAYAMKGDRERFLNAGFDRYLTKPLDLAELVREMRELAISKGMSQLN